MEYGDANRAFLQAFLARSVLTLESAKPIIAAIRSVQTSREVQPGEITLADFTSYISTANSALSLLDLEIRSMLHQQTRERCYALVNTTSDPLTQMATTYTADEIAFVKKLLDAMFDGAANRGKREAMCLRSMDAVQVVQNANRRETQNGTQPIRRGLTMAEAQTMLTRLVGEGWLDKSTAGFYSLSPRALIELKGWLVDTYNEPGQDDEERPGNDKIKFCHACKEIITVGQCCPQRECPCRLHDICTQQFFRSQRSQTCPLCKTNWDGKSFVGEKAITTSESYQKGKRRHTNRQDTEPELEREVEAEVQADENGLESDHT